MTIHIPVWVLVAACIPIGVIVGVLAAFGCYVLWLFKDWSLK